MNFLDELAVCRRKQGSGALLAVACQWFRPTFFVDYGWVLRIMVESGAVGLSWRRFFGGIVLLSGPWGVGGGSGFLGFCVLLLIQETIGARKCKILVSDCDGLSLVYVHFPCCLSYSLICHCKDDFYKKKILWSFAEAFSSL